MELSPKQQINELIKNNHSILIVSHSSLNGDALGSMLALEKVLTKLGKEVSLVSSETIKENYQFLPNLSKIKDTITGSRDLILKFDNQKTPIGAVSYHREDNSVNVIITPKMGKLSQSDIEFVQGNFKYDLIFVLDTPSVNKIDTVYDRETELFFETPIINVDHHPGNEYFGTVNFVDLTATSTCEILVSIIESFGAGNFDQEVATCLLTGIIADTGSFKYENTTSKSLTISAQMLAAGAKQQEIISHLYKNRSINTLKASGEFLSRIDYNQDFRLALAAFSAQDAKLEDLSIDDLRNIFNDYFINIPEADFSLLLFEDNKNKIYGLIQTKTKLDLTKIITFPEYRAYGQRLEFDLTGLTLKATLNQIVSNIALAEGKTMPSINTDVSQTKTVEPVLPEPPKPEDTETLLKETEVVDFSDDPISKAIESIDQEIDETPPSIDIEDAKAKEDTIKPLGSILESHQPGAALDDDASPYSPSELEGIGNKNIGIRTWQED